MEQNSNEKSAVFEKYNERYVNGYCTKKQLKKLVKLGVLTQEEYDTIVGTNE